MQQQQQQISLELQQFPWSQMKASREEKNELSQRKQLRGCLASWLAGTLRSQDASDSGRFGPGSLIRDLSCSDTNPSSQ